MHRGAKVEVIVVRTSDHNPLLVRFENKMKCGDGGRWGFKFEARWKLDPECSKIIEEVWKGYGYQDGAMKTVQRNLEQCQIRLQGWNRRKYGNVEKKIKEMTKQLIELQKREGNVNQVAIKQLQLDIDILMELEDIKWKQRVKQNWYQYGDRNTPFFHAWTNHRRRITK